MHRGRRGVAVYKTTIRVEPERRARLDFGGAGLWCAVFVDGIRRAEHFDTYAGFSVDLPPAARAARDIAVVLDTRFNPALNPLQEPYYDFYQHGGIIRPVHLHVLPSYSILNVLVRIKDYRAGKIAAEIHFEGEAPEIVPLAACIDGQPVFAGSVTVKDGTAMLPLLTPEPTLWTCESPALHVLELSSGKDDFITRYGLREIAVDGERILLNGTPIKIKGVALHAIHPESGSAITPLQMFNDLNLIKDLGCNFIRAVHYPHDSRLFDLCDELGLLAWEESLGWNNRERHYADPRFRAAQLAALRAMIVKDFNHPSVIIWSFLNEGFNPPRAENGPPFFREMFDLAKSLDPSRLVTLPNTCFEDTWDKMPPFDLVCYNIYPAWYYYDLPDGVEKEISEWREKSRQIAGQPIPFLISEIGADAIYGWRDSHEARWTEQYQAKVLDEACRIVLSRDDIAGMAIWLFADYRGCEELDSGHGHILRRARGYNNKGLVDEYRRPKLAFDIVKRHFTGRRGP